MPPAALLARSVLLRSVRPGPAPRGVSKGPQQSALSPVESFVGFAAMFAACLGPAAWVLAHLNDYKKRE